MDALESRLGHEFRKINGKESVLHLYNPDKYFYNSDKERPEIVLFSYFRENWEEWDDIGNTSTCYKVISMETDVHYAQEFIARAFDDPDQIVDVTTNLITLRQRLERLKQTQPSLSFEFEDLIGVLLTPEDEEECETYYLLTEFIHGNPLPNHGMYWPSGQIDPAWGRVYHPKTEDFVLNIMPNSLGFRHTDAHGKNFLYCSGCVYLIDPVKFEKIF